MPCSFLALLTMKMIALWPMLLAIILATQAIFVENSSLEEKFHVWATTHGRSYKDDSEKEEKFKTFQQNLEYIERANIATRPYKLAPNNFADLTEEEFKEMFLLNEIFPSNEMFPSRMATFDVNDSVVPSNVDWRTKGAVTPVKQQGLCGSCWAFAAVAATESVNQLRTGRLVSLSEQELVDCETSESKGCKYGFPDKAFDYIIRNQGLMTESNYPYEAVAATCKAGKESFRDGKITAYKYVPTNNEAVLKSVVAQQPVVVLIDSSANDFRFYSTGIFTGPCGTNLDHAVTIAAYGVTEDGTKYWTLKNSWGGIWGESGYGRIVRDIDSPNGICGIAMYPTF